ncbi:MAG: ATP-dependent RecD-like DNA helicase [Candidatus Hydrogenedentes bacterium]|nr:ATP-dependent RecD-like DNA helicase [Candidatus Hydrogenedentota bacterium]
MDTPDQLDIAGREATVCIEGTVERIVYESQESGFLVGRLIEEGKREPTTFVGNVIAVSAGETIRLWGRWVDDRKFGRQFRIERYETVVPSTAAAIEKYLGSGLVRGIGPAFAKRLVAAFGVETLRVIDEEPKRLRSVAGIGRTRAKRIREAWAGQKAIQSIMLFLQGHGIGVGQAVRIYKRYGDAAVAVLRENPYRLAQDIAGIGFRSADAIAEQLGIAKDSPKRAEAGLLYTLERASSEGHVYLPEAELIERAAALLAVEAGTLEGPLAAAVERRAAVRDGDALYLPALYEDETGCDRLLKRLVSVPLDPVPIKVDKAIEWVEARGGIQLSDEQRAAIRTAVSSKVMVITGGPGTGKTTVLNGLLDIFDKKGLAIQLAAPTGRAAKRMETATGREARTIHRLLEYSPKQGGFTRNEGNPVAADLVVIDECSMVDVGLMHSLLKAMPPQARVFLVGDVDQLPSVGPGNVLLDIIASAVFPVVWLKTVFRQAAESGIIANAHRINRGEYPEFNTTDFFFVERKDPAKAREAVLELVTERIPKKFGLDPKRDIQVLAPMHRGEVGVTRLNETLQAALNPSVAPIGRKSFGKGDKVMQLRNNYELDVYNGDVGVITVVDEELKEAQVVFDDERAVVYAFEDLDELALAYASTVHKSQGSEYGAVVVPLLTQHYMMLVRNILYTAVTRAKALVIVVGDPKAVGLAVRNTDVARRNTRLADRLRNRSAG